MEKESLNIQIGTVQAPEGVFVEVQQDGPYIVHGVEAATQEIITPDARGTSVTYTKGKAFKMKDGTALCRCGLSADKPYCDGSHASAAQYGIDLAETATFDAELKTAEMIQGPVLSLTDDEKLCAYARFCDNGERIWNQVQEADAASQKLSTEMANHCPGGRLIIWDNATEKPVETSHQTSVGLIEDGGLQCSAGIALHGGIPLKSADGEFYEVRNRQALCRCGQSSNKPFCDGTHASVKFQDGLG